MGHTKSHMKKKARGGGLHEKHMESDDQGEPEMHEAKERKFGGKVAGHKGKHRAKKARGGAANSTDSPFSSAHRGGM